MKNDIIFSNKKIAILGFGISNKAVFNYLQKKNCASIDIYDNNVENLDVSAFNFSEFQNKIKNYDIIFRTPGIHPQIKELNIARKYNIKISSEIELLLESVNCKIIGITGSDGKSTTTKIISKLLKNSGKNVYLGGNIGKPLIEFVDVITKDDILVLELSSFQLMTLKKSPNISVITNITPNHLNYHKDFKEYIYAKKNIFQYQSKDDILVLNKNDDVSNNIACESISKIRYINDKNSFHLKDDYIWYLNRKILNINDIMIPGRHNIDNFMCAIAAVYNIVDKKVIKKTALSFTGLEHRQEIFLRYNDITYINDSIASSPNRTITGLRIFEKKVILIAGGKDKKIPYDEIGKPICKHVKFLILIGETANQIYESVRKIDENLPVYFAQTLKEAIIESRNQAKSGDVIYFSPASTSFDMFKNFEERGKKFKNIVNELINEET